jgi:plasmid maintenance system killer protein
MEIEFKDKDIETCCTQPGIARISYGLANEKKLMRVMTALNSAGTLQDLKATYPKSHWLDDDRYWQVGVPLADARRLILEPQAYTTREWREIEAITIIEITDYHK